MAFTVRSARPDDLEQIAPWTRDTFDWGDYVADSLEEWLHSPDQELLVATGPEGVPVAVSLVQMLSATEGWLSAARVNPEFRRQGIGSMLNNESVRWVTERGALVVRLATEAVNQPSRNQVIKLGYRPTSIWIYGKSEGVVSGKVESSDKLSVVGRADVDPAWMYWSTSEFADMARSLVPSGWKWRRATVSDIDRAARERRLLGNAAGWLVVEEFEDEIDVVWVASSQNDFPRLLNGIRHLIIERDLKAAWFRIPETGWSGEALKREGIETSEVIVYSKPILKSP